MKKVQLDQYTFGKKSQKKVMELLPNAKGN